MEVVTEDSVRRTSPPPAPPPALPPAPPPAKRPSRPFQEQRLVIGLDYGTTFTGVAFATPQGDRCTLDEIDVNAVWGNGMANTHKVPSVISYSNRSDAMEQQWGDSLSPNAIAMVHTKLELDVQDVSEELDFILQSLDGMKNLHFQHVKASQGMPAYTDKSAEDIVAEYLTKVCEVLIQTVERNAKMYVGLRGRTSTDLVVTIPTGWSYRAMNSTYRAFTKAGFNRINFPALADVMFVTEPEAAAVYTSRHLKDVMRQDFLKVKECFVLCDAGGGTVDLVSYKVKQLDPTLELEEVGVPTGRKCGSTFIDMAFKNYLRWLLPEKFYQMLDPTTEMNKISSHTSEGPAMRELMKRFTTLKRKFTKNNMRDMHLDLPAPLANLTIPGRVDGGEITITFDLMSRFFDVCVTQIIQLIQGHIDQIDRSGSRTKNIFLVGGFAESEYLQQEIEFSLQLRGITLRRPDTSWTAVVRGAVICGIEKSTTQKLTKAVPCRHNYGICADLLFSDVRHENRDLVRDNFNQALAKGQMIWMLNKGDLVLSDRPKTAKEDITVSFGKTDSRKGKVTIYMYSDEDQRPLTLRNAREELTVAQVLEYDLSNAPLTDFETRRGPDKKPIYIAVLTLRMVLKGVELEAFITWKNTLLIRATNISYY